MTHLVIATRNTHKVQEIRAILGENFRFFTLRDFPEAPEVIEDGLTFAANAEKKAVELAAWLANTSPPLLLSRPNSTKPIPWFVLADDSGLELDVLHGAPGIHSARFAASESGAIGNASDAANRQKLLQLLAEIPVSERAARFRCVIALTSLTPAGLSYPSLGNSVSPTGGPIVELFEGVCEGRITTECRGHGGFGYDPLFIPEGYNQTFAELGEDIKNQISHRGRALNKLSQRLLQNNPRR